MAKNVLINGVTYQNVPGVNVPLADGSGMAKFVDTDSGDAKATDIRAGKKGWVDGAEITGSMPERDSADVTAAGKTVTIPAGIYDEQVQKSVQDGSVTPGADVTGDEIGDTTSDYPVTITPKATVGKAGYISAVGNGTAVKKYIQVEKKTVTPTTSKQTIMPTNGKLINSVEVAAVDIPGTATEAHVIAGYTFLSGGSLTLKTGSATVPAIGQDSTTKFLSIT